MPPTYSDNEVAALYNVLNPWGVSDDFYLELVVNAPSVLDVGCGTGTLLHRARAEGHTGDLAGIDPDPAMLALARRESSVEWHEGSAAEIPWHGRFSLAVMTGHAFQVFVTDDELDASLRAIHRALIDNGRFVFETRNPARREWESWTPEYPIDAVDPAGRVVRITYRVVGVTGDVVTVTETTSDAAGTVLRVDQADLRFLDRERLTSALETAGFALDDCFGDWCGKPFNDEAKEIITVARKR